MQFLTEGKLISSGGRNNTIFAASIEMFNAGYSLVEVEGLIGQANISWEGLTEKEAKRTILSAQRKACG
jgi:hypothetical protein